MLRFYLPFLLMTIYGAWIIWKIIKHRSIKRFRSEILFGIYFALIWIIIYSLLK